MLGILVLTACGSSQDHTTEDPEDQTAAVEQEDDTDSSEEQGPEDVTLQLDDAEQTISYPMQGYDGEITMGIFTPKVQGETMIVSVVFEPVFADEDEDGVKFKELHHDTPNAVLMPVVSDRENFKAYHVPRETTNQHAQGGGWAGGMFADGTWASAIGDVEVRSGEQYQHWAYFPAPEDDIDTVDIAVVPGMQEFRDVPIDWGSAEPGSTGTEEAAQE